LKLAPSLKILSLGFVLFCVAPAYGANVARSAGTRGAEFLRIDVGARHVAMGGTYAAYGYDVFSLHGQPSAIAARSGYEVGFQHNEWVQGINQEYGGVQGPIGSGRWAITANGLGASNIERTSDDAFGRFGAVNGTFGVQDLAVALHYARPINTRTSAGIALRYIRSSIDNISADGFGVDVGGRFAVSDRFTVGASVTNAGQGLKFLRDRSDLPITARLGGAYNFGRVTVASDLVYAEDDNLEGAFGAEWRVVEMLALRAGYKTQAADDLDEGLTAGLGLNFSGISLDYAYAPFGVLGESHRVSGAVSF
jgi:hypothetical protein